MFDNGVMRGFILVLCLVVFVGGIASPSVAESIHESIERVWAASETTEGLIHATRESDGDAMRESLPKGADVNHKGEGRIHWAHAGRNVV